MGYNIDYSTIKYSACFDIVSLTTAVALLELLLSAGATGLVLKAAYRKPPITFVDAYLLADTALEQKQQESFPTYQFQPTSFYQEKPRGWTFMSSCPQFIDQGSIPGALFVDVDKLDGHIWQTEEYTEQ